MDNGDTYDFAQIYKDANMNPQGAIQSFGGTAKPNTMKDQNDKDTYNYGGLTYNTENGSFTCNG